MNTSRIVITTIAMFGLTATTITSVAVAEEISAEERFELQIMREQHLQEKLVSAFEELGLKAVVRVSVQMDWTTEKREAIRLEPPVLISHMESSSEESSPGNAAIPNVPEEIGPRKSASTSELIENFDSPREVTESLTPSGIVRHLSVAAFIEGDLTPVYDEHGKKTGESEYHPLSREDIGSYAQFIRAAVGEGLERTYVYVIDHPFRRTRNSRR